MASSSNIGSSSTAKWSGRLSVDDPFELAGDALAMVELLGQLTPGARPVASRHYEKLPGQRP